MIGARATRRFARLSLAARMAAARFVTPRAPGRGARVGWRPLALRWRRPRPRRGERLIVRAAPATSAIWSPRYHLHLAFTTRAHVRAGAPTRVGSPAVVRDVWRRLTVERWRARGRQGDGGAGAPVARHGSGFIAAGKPPAVVRRRAAAERARALASLTLAAPRDLSHARRKSAALPAQTRELVPAGATFPRATRVAPRLLSRASELRLRAARAATPASGVAGERRERAAFQVRAPRPADIVWRRAPRFAPESADEARPLLPAAARPPSTRSSAMPGASASEPARPGRVAPLRAADIDPSVLDRVTDDVIRRVERRVRIERERRGQ